MATRREWFRVDLEHGASDLLPEELSTAWVTFAFEEVFLGIVHLRSGRVFAWEKDMGLTCEAESFGAFLASFADALWAGKHTLVHEEPDDETSAWNWETK